MKRGILSFLFSFILFAISYGKANNPPSFVNGSSQTLSICQNVSSVAIDANLYVQDLDLNQTLVFTIVGAPAHGTLHGFPGTGSTNGSVYAPSGFSYTPTVSFSGSDVFTIQVSDGTNSVTTTLNVTVNTLPTIAQIKGGSAVCIGNTLQLTNSTQGGVWTSSNPLVATIDSFTGLVTSQAVGTTSIIYTVTNLNGCANIATLTLTVSGYPNVSSIKGTGTVCVGATTQLTDATVGGTWASSNTTIATVVGGLVTGVTSGFADITYNLTNNYGCTGTATLTVAVNPSPTVGSITSSTTTICTGTQITFSNSTSGGTWSSSNTKIATVSTNGGVVRGISAGKDTISYAIVNANGCSGSKSVEVTVVSAPVLSPNTGVASLCVNGTTQLSNSTPGGKWSSGNNIVAQVDSISGVVTGIRTGNATITYTVSSGASCTAQVSTRVSVNSLPTVAAITGINSICTGTLDTLSNTTPGGVWSSSDPTIATISSTGVAKGVGVGVDTISYTVTNGTSCSTTQTFVLTVSTGLTIPAIDGPSSVCLNSTITLTNQTSGGTWKTSDFTIGYVDTKGVVTALSPGIVTITYTVGGGNCSASTTKNIIVSDLPNVGANNLSTASLCVGDTLKLTNSYAGGVWSSSSNFIRIDTGGNVTSTRATSGTIKYTATNIYGCSQSASTNITTNTKPNPFVINGSNSTCIGSIITLTLQGTGGATGSWTSSNTTVASVIGTGTVIGKTTGTADISYTITNGNGCSRTTTLPITIAPALYVSSITGSSDLCLGTNYQFTDSTSGGTWTSSDATIVQINNGAVTPQKAGTADIIYSVDNGNGCSGSVTKTVTVYNKPATATISGKKTVCTGDTVILSSNISGGFWSTASQQVTIDSFTGVVKGIVSLGGNPATVSYTTSNAAGCKSTVNYQVSVSAGPNIGRITGATSVCEGATTTLVITTTGGTWSSVDTSVSTVDASGVVTGVKAGNSLIQYSVSNGTGCASVANAQIRVNSIPVLVASVGLSNVCSGSSILLSNPSTIPNGGTFAWSSSDNNIATVNANSGLVTGLSAGTATITYKVSQPSLGPNVGCSNSITKTVTVNPYPVLGAIKASKSIVCVGATINFSDTTIGGVWAVNDTTKATITQSGVLTGVSGGNVNITYSLATNGCTSTVFTSTKVADLPVVGNTSGNAVACVGANAQLSNPTTGGVWSSALSGIASVDNNGLVTGQSSGNTSIDYTVTNTSGCSAKSSIVFTVNPLPNISPINGPAALCIGNGASYSSTSSGGTWSSSNTAIGIIDANGNFNTVSQGTDSIYYSVTNGFGCTNKQQFTVTVTPVPLASFTVNKTSQCVGGNYFVFTNTSTISNGTVTYQWTIDGKTFTSVSPTYVFASAGTYNVKLIVNSNGGCSDTAIKTVLVTPAPQPAFVVSNNSQCLTGNAFAFNNTTPDLTLSNTYSWKFGDGAVSNVTSPSYSYAKAGVYTVKLIVTTASGCIDSTSQSVTLTQNVSPSVTIVSSASIVCKGTSVTFTASPTNGGTVPVYQWTKNGVNVGTNSVTYTDNTLKSNDIVLCTLTTSVQCYTALSANSKPISITVSDFVTPSVTISTTTTSACAGTSIQFTAAPVNGGVNPSYQWLVNGVLVNGSNGATFSTPINNSSDIVTANLLSNAACVTASSVSSNPVSLTITPNVVPSISITSSASTINVGSNVTFSANVQNAGAAPFYQWFKNGIAIPGANTSIYSTSTLADKDTVYCQLTSSLGCVTVPTTTSNKLVETVISSYTISGAIKTEAGNAIRNAVVYLNNTDSVVTNSNGSYSFTTKGFTNNVVRVSKTTDSIVSNGVTTLDVLYLQAHILNKNPITSPYRLIAADVNNDKKVSTIDLLYEKRFILNLDQTFPGGRTWTFVDSAYQFPDFSKPFPYKDSIDFPNLSENKSSQSFVGIKLGDINLDANKLLFGASKNVSKKVTFDFDDINAANSDVVRVPIRVRSFKEIMGMQFTLGYNSEVFDFVKIDNNVLGFEYANSTKHAGRISFVWTDAKNNGNTLVDGYVLMELVLRKKSNSDKNELQLLSDITPIEVVDKDYQLVGLEKSGTSLSNPENVSVQTAGGLNIYPNPTTNGKVTIHLSLDKATKVKFELLNEAGRVLSIQQVDLPKGSMTKSMDISTLTNRTTGNYFLRVTGDELTLQIAKIFYSN